MADVGLSPPAPPLSNVEMQEITFAAKVAILRCLRKRKRKVKTNEEVCARCRVIMTHGERDICNTCKSGSGSLTG